VLQPMIKTAFLIVTVLFLTVNGSGCNSAAPTPNQSDAEKAARAAVEEFAKSKSIPLDSIGPPVTHFDQPPGLWRVSYRTTSRPAYLIDVIVNRSGRPEISVVSTEDGAPLPPS